MSKYKSGLFFTIKNTSGFATTKLWFGHIYSRQKVKFLGFEKKYIISLMLEFTNYGPKLTSYECFRYIFKKIHTLELNQNLQDLKLKI